MGKRLIVSLTAISFSFSAAPSQAAMKEAQACSAPIPLAPELSNWERPIHTIAGAKALSSTSQSEAAPILAVGPSVELQLSPLSEIHFPVGPAKQVSTDSYGGMFALPVVDAGTYRLALSAGAWVDVIGRESKTALTSIGHSHGPECSSIRKMVDFTLKAGTYWVQIAGNKAPHLTLMVTRLP